MNFILCRIILCVYTWQYGVTTAVLPQITKITNGTLSNVTINSQRTIKTYGQAIVGLLKHMEIDSAIFILTKSEQLCAPIWETIASERSVKAQFFIDDYPDLDSPDITYDIRSTKSSTALVSNLQKDQLQNLLNTIRPRQFCNWVFIIFGARVPIIEFFLRRHAPLPVFVVEFQHPHQRRRHKPITFYDYQYNTKQRHGILIPFASWKTGILRCIKTRPNGKAFGFFNGRITAIEFVRNHPISGYGPKNETNTYAAHMLQNLNDYFGGRLYMRDMGRDGLFVNYAVEMGMTITGINTNSKKSTKIPTMGKFCIGFAFLKVKVPPTTEIFVNPFPKEIWVISFIVIFSGHVLLKFQVILQKICKKSIRKVGIQEWIFLDVDEDLRLAKYLHISTLSVKLVVISVIVTSFTCNMLYSMKFASNLTNLKDIDIPYHSAKEFYEKWQESSTCYTSLMLLGALFFNNKLNNAAHDSRQFFAELYINNSKNFVYYEKVGRVTSYFHEQPDKECYINYLDILKYLFQSQCTLGIPKDNILCTHVAPLAFDTWFPFLELYQHALLTLKENGIAKRLRQQYLMDYKDCNHVSSLKPIELSVTKYILFICLTGLIIAIIVMLLERIAYNNCK